MIATGNYDYGLKLLLSCCTLDRANLIYRQTLRRSEKAKYKDNLRGSWLSWLTTSPAKARLKAALRSGDYISVLDVGERVLLRNPWDIGTQMDMAHAAEELGLIDLAVWSLEQARQKDATDPNVNKALALIYEKRGNFTQAMALWNLVRKARPADAEAQSKLMELAAHDTIQRGNLEALTQTRTDRTASPAKRNHPPRGAPRRRFLLLLPRHRRAGWLAIRCESESMPTRPICIRTCNWLSSTAGPTISKPRERSYKRAWDRRATPLN